MLLTSRRFGSKMTSKDVLGSSETESGASLHEKNFLEELRQHLAKRQGKRGPWENYIIREFPSDGVGCCGQSFSTAHSWIKHIRKVHNTNKKGINTFTFL